MAAGCLIPQDSVRTTRDWEQSGLNWTTFDDIWSYPNFLSKSISMSRAHRISSWCMSDFTSRFSPRISPRLSWTAVVFWVIHISWVWLLSERWKDLCLNIAWHALSFFTISVPSMETTQARERLRHWQHKYKFIFEFFDPITDLDLSRFRERTTALLSCVVDMILISRLLGSVTATLSLSTLQIPNGSDCKRTFVMKTPLYWNILTQRLWKSHIMRRPSERYRPLVMTQSILSDGTLT